MRLVPKLMAMEPEMLIIAPIAHFCTMLAPPPLAACVDQTSIFATRDRVRCVVVAIARPLTKWLTDWHMLRPLVRWRYRDEDTGACICAAVANIGKTHHHSCVGALSTAVPE